MENIELKSLEEVAVEVLREQNESLTYIELFNKVAEAKQFNDEERAKYIAQFYTDITASGNFVYCGDDKWDLKEHLKVADYESEYYSEHADIEGYEEEKPAKRRKSRKSSVSDNDGELSIDTTHAEMTAHLNKDDDYNSDEQDYEKGYQDDEDDYNENDGYFDSDEEDERYEEDDESYSEDEDSDDDYDDDEEEYNAIMDQFEDEYDN
ncbi:MAG: DNA-directed RNA polymerase subunit delta [Gammaproteobacteria bacterium]|nr:DNA-directed RNA polymerase subunit delta [Gammaproteobacteria bacterium]